MTEQTVKVPMIISLPEKIRRTAIDSGLFSQIDVGPTLLDLCKIKPTVMLDGNSNAQRLLKGSIENVPDSVYCFQGYNTMIRTDTEKLINYPKQPYGEYYNLDEDKYETNNLYYEREKDVNRLKCEMLDFISDSRYLGTPQMASSYPMKMSSDYEKRPRLHPENNPKDPYKLH